MKDTISCQIIEDLLPLYADGVVSQDSRTLIQGHLQNCPHCQRELEALSRPVTLPPEQSGKGELKRWKHRLRRKITATALLLALVVLTLGAGCFTALFVKLGTPIARLESYDRAHHAPEQAQLLLMRHNEHMAILLYEQDDTVYYSFYTTLPGLSTGYHLKESGTWVNPSGLYAYSMPGKSTMVLSLNQTEDIIQVAELVRNPSIAGMTYALNPGEPFVLFFPALDIDPVETDAYLYARNSKNETIPFDSFVIG